MVGPTGPELLRSGGRGYGSLLRLRVLNAPGDSRPFGDCVKFVERLGLSESEALLHQSTAAEFSEFFDSTDAPVASVAALDISVKPLTELAEQAWPFVREGYLRLVQSSSHTREAAHPTVPLAPGLGSGLPDRPVLYRSTAVFGNRVLVAWGSGAHLTELTSDDGGVHFEQRGHGLTSELADRCVIDGEGRSYTLTATDQGERVVLSHGPGAAPHVAMLSPQSNQLLAIACDRAALVAILAQEAPVAAGGSAPSLVFRVCPYRRGCENLTVPRLGARELRAPIDIARVEGDTVIATVTGGLTRVASSRDSGRTWAPWSVAFDRSSLESDLGLSAPARLLTVGDRVLLYGGAKRKNEAYYLLVSSDHGATFRAPE